MNVFNSVSNQFFFHAIQKFLFFNEISVFIHGIQNRIFECD